MFGKTKWVERQLTPKELAKGFDIPVGVHEKFCSWPLVELPRLQTAPSKILLQTAMSLLKGGIIQQMPMSLGNKGKQKVVKHEEMNNQEMNNQHGEMKVRGRNNAVKLEERIEELEEGNKQKKGNQ